MSSLEQLGRNKPQDLELEVDTPDSSGGDNDGAGGAGRRADDGSDGEPSREELWKEMMKLKKQLRGLRVAEAEVPGRAAAEAAMRSLASRGRARERDHAPAKHGGGILRSALARPGRDTPRPPSPRRRRRSSRGRRRRKYDSGESSSDDSDYESDRRSRRRGDGGYRDGDRVAAKILRKIEENGYRTVTAYVRQQPITNDRSRHEARRAAQAIDAFIKEGVSADFLGMEILVRTVSGIVKADTEKNPKLLEQWEWQPPESILDRDMEQVLYRNVERVLKLEKKRTNPSSAADGSRARD